MFRMHLTIPALATAVTLAVATPAGAQHPAGQEHAYDPSSRLSVLPDNVEQQVLDVIAKARSRGLPAQALERTALKGVARDVPAADIERAVVAQAERMERVQEALARVENRRTSGEEIEAGAEALRNGVDVSQLVELATSAPSGRSLAVPMHVLGSLIARDLPPKEALTAVLAKLDARAPDAEIAQLPEQVVSRPAGKPELTGRDVAGTKRAGGVGAPPAGVPTNGGADVRPTVPKPNTPSGRP
ncbi:MAG: hypothetical protein ACT4PJ_10420 [Gemmatimonadaceae bacterium]